jgi:Xaa-Pro aminopeptidase
MLPVGFPPEEYQARWARAQTLMGETDLDALLVTEEHNYMYFSGHRVPYSRPPGSSPSRPSAVLLPRDAEPVVIVQLFHQADARRTSAARDVRAYTEFANGAPMLIRDVLRERGIRRGRVGAELGYEQRLGMPFNEFLLLQKETPGVEFVDAADVFWRLRMVKSEAEAACIRAACHITSRAYASLFAQFKEGMTEREAAAILSIAMVQEGADRPGLLDVTSGAGRYDRTSDAPTHRVVRRGDMLWLDAGAIVNGYWADFSRAGVVGGPTAEQLAMQQTVNDLTRRGVDMVRPGVPVAEIARACYSGLERLGRQTNVAGRIGHGVGLHITEPPHVATYDPTILAPGMVITVEPGIITEYGAFHIEQNVLVTRDGCEVLSIAPRELATLG